MLGGGVDAATLDSQRVSKQGHRHTCIDAGRHASTLNPPNGASSNHIGFGWPVAVPRTLPFSSVAMRLGPVWPARYTRVSALRSVSLLCVVLGGGGVFRRDKRIIINR